MKKPTVRTIKRLYATYGNQCAFPQCTTPLVDPNSGTVLGQVCHIKGNRTDSPRHDSTQSDQERQGFANLMLLCGVHHKTIDDDLTTYTVERLHQIKEEHEAKHKGGPAPSKDVVDELLNRLVKEVANITQVVEPQDESENDEDPKFKAQLENWTSALSAKIASRGYYSVIIHPQRYRAQAISILDLEGILKSAQVTLTIPSPAFPAMYGRTRPEKDWISQELEDGLEQWRFYQSGQFEYQRAFTEDWPTQPYHPQLGGYELVDDIMAIFVFAARLIQHPKYPATKRVVMQINLHGLRNREFRFPTGSRVPYRGNIETDTVSYSATIPIEELSDNDNYMKSAHQALKEIAYRIGWQGANDWLEILQARNPPRPSRETQL